MAAVFIATFMTSVEVTIVTTALPEIISALNGLAAQSWIMSAYLLTTAITTPIYGKLADSWGRRKIFQWGVIVFTIGSLFSGLARTMPILIIARAVQGIGAGAVMPLTFTIIADYYDFKERAKVLALNNSAWALSSLVGPMIGGFLVDTLSWHWVFFVNVPLGILVAILIQFGYREPKSESSNFKIDHKGISLLTIALITLLMGVQLLAKQIIIAIVLLIISVVSIYLFIRAEKMVSDPLISPKLFKNQTFFAQIATATILSGVLMGYEVYFPIWLQSLYRLSATTAGMVVTSSSVLWLISSFFVGPLLNRFIPKKISLTVVSVLIISYSILSFAGLNFPVWAFYVIAMVNGAGMGIVISMNLVLAQNSAPTEMVGSASSIVTLGRSLGQTVMTGVYGTILNLMINATRGTIPFSKINNMISSSGKTNHPTVEMAQVVLNGLHGIFISAAILLVICWFINLRDPLNKIVDK
ncbi:MFS transporter [Xylocopilactobacillus apicola]|nr:MFS transporter [Xylocopilactobacillus apicola]